MSKQTENYLILKPIAERFSKVASEITDDDIKDIIRCVIKEKVQESIDFSVVEEKITEWIDDNSDQVVRVMQDAISERLKLPRGYIWH